MRVNKGIVVTGSGRVHAGAMAAGDGARAENSGAVPDGPQRVAELHDQLAELVAALRSRTDLADAGELADTAARADAELDADQPNKHVLAGLLGGLAAGVAHVGELAEAVGKIQHAVSTLF